METNARSFSVITDHIMSQQEIKLAHFHVTTFSRFTRKSQCVIGTLCDRHTCSNSMAHLVSFLQRKQTQPSWDLRLRLSKLGNQSDQSSSWQIFITSPIKDDLHKSDIINTAPGTLPIYCKDFTIHCTALPHFLELPYWHYQLVLI